MGLCFFGGRGMNPFLSCRRDRLCEFPDHLGNARRGPRLNEQRRMKISALRLDVSLFMYVRPLVREEIRYMVRDSPWRIRKGIPSASRSSRDEVDNEDAQLRKGPGG